MDTLCYKVIVHENILAQAQKVSIEKRLIVNESQISPYPSILSAKLFLFYLINCSQFNFKCMHGIEYAKILAANVELYFFIEMKRKLHLISNRLKWYVKNIYLHMGSE